MAPDYGWMKLSFREYLSIDIFLGISFVAQFSLLSYLCGLPLLCLICLYPQHWWALTSGISVMALAAFYLVLDSMVYREFHFHAVGVVWQVVRSGDFSQVFDLTGIEYALAGIILGIIVLIEIVLAFWIWNRLEQQKKWPFSGTYVGISLLAFWFLSYTLFISSAALGEDKDHVITTRHIIVLKAQIIPFYTTLLSFFTSGSFSNDKNWQTVGQGLFIQPKQVVYPLRYPLHPMRCEQHAHPLNIVIIGADTLRADALNAKAMPHVSAFAARAWQFQQHYSGGNSTQPGLFSLFYALPSIYWTAMKDQHQGPVFINELLKQKYQMGVFMSAPMHFPAFDETIFLPIKDKQLDTPGADAYQRDHRITQEFAHFLHHRDPSHPFFAFLFYDAVHSFCEKQPKGFATPFRPQKAICNRAELRLDLDAAPYHNRYLNAVYFDDAEISKALTLLRKEGLMGNTLIIFTADHGASFNDHHNGYWGHAAGFVHEQTRVPLWIYWPGKGPHRFTHKTSHFDVVPFLMSHIGGCQNPLKDYSVGQALLTPDHRPYLIIGSYVDYAIDSGSRYTEIYPEGTYEIKTARGRLIPEARLNFKELKQVYADITRYFKQPRHLDGNRETI